MTTSAAARVRSYFAASRAPRYSLLFALPLLLAYEVLAAVLAGAGASYQVRNGADVILREVSVAALGSRGPLVLMASIILLLTRPIFS